MSEFEEKKHLTRERFVFFHFDASPVQISAARPPTNYPDLCVYLWEIIHVINSEEVCHFYYVYIPATDPHLIAYDPHPHSIYALNPTSVVILYSCEYVWNACKDELIRYIVF